MFNEKVEILVINTMCIGDLMLTTPALRVLKTNFSNSHIAMIVDQRYKEVVEGNPHLDEIISLDKKGQHKGLAGIWNLVQRLRKRKLDLVVNLSCNERSTIITILSNAKKKLGYAHRGQGFFLDGKIPFKIIPQGKRHMVDAHLDILRIFNLDCSNHNGLEIFPSNDDHTFAQHFLQENGVKDDELLIGVNAGANWPTKRWSREGFAQVADALVEKYSARVIFFGGPDDKEMVNAVISMMKNRPIVATGKTTLKQLAALINRCKLFITGDTGPMHIAVGVKTPVVAIYGPSPVGGFAPYGDGHTIIRKGTCCSPCGKHHCDKHDCMKLITAEEVLKAVENYFL